jgi:hypothetical protein
MKIVNEDSQKEIQSGNQKFSLFLGDFDFVQSFVGFTGHGKRLYARYCIHRNPNLHSTIQVGHSRSPRFNLKQISWMF